MKGERKGRRRQTLKLTGEMKAVEVNGYGRRSGKWRTPCGTRSFWYSSMETGDAWVEG